MPDRAVIFDMDGVLADTYRAHFESWRRLYDQIGVPYDEVSFAADFGRTSRDILRRSLGNTLTEQQIHQYDSRKEAYFREYLRERSAVMDGAVELIDSLASHGWKLAVGSSGPPENIELMLNQLGRADKFCAVVTGADVTRGKPDPQVFLLAANRLAMKTVSCVVIEDAVHGVQAAHNAGMKCVALIGTATRGELSQADLVVESLRQVTHAALEQLLKTPAR